MTHRTPQRKFGRVSTSNNAKKKSIDLEDHTTHHRVIYIEQQSTMSAASFSPLLRFAALVLIAATVTSAFVSNTPVSPRMTASSDSQLGMGMFDFIKGAFENEAYENRRVTASHILVESPEEAAVVAKSIQAGETTFSDAARDFSTCPSSKDGGSLGTFEPGSMLPEFEAVVFDEEKSPIGEIVGPVQTKFGYHLVRVDKRFLNQDRSEGSGFL